MWDFAADGYCQLYQCDNHRPYSEKERICSDGEHRSYKQAVKEDADLGRDYLQSHYHCADSCFWQYGFLADWEIHAGTDGIFCCQLSHCRVCSLRMFVVCILQLNCVLLIPEIWRGQRCSEIADICRLNDKRI